MDLEREAFLSLCGEPKTLERIQSYVEDRQDVEKLMIRYRERPPSGRRARHQRALGADEPGIEALARGIG